MYLAIRTQSPYCDKLAIELFPAQRILLELFPSALHSFEPGYWVLTSGPASGTHRA